MTRADLTYVNLSSADINGSNLENAILRCTDFSNSNATNVNFFKSDITKAIFSSTTIFTGSIMANGKIYYPGADLTKEIEGPIKER